MASIRNAGQMFTHPIRVWAAGWESDTLTLERHGWRFHAEYSVEYMATLIVLEQPREQYSGMVSMLLGAELTDRDLRNMGQPLCISANPFTHVREDVVQEWKLRPVSMLASLMHERDIATSSMMMARPGESCRLMDARQLFVGPNDEYGYADEVNERRIVLPNEQTVDQLLDALLEKQAPQRKEYARRERIRNERRVGLYVPVQEEAA